MAHHIRAIVAPPVTADSWPALPCLSIGCGSAIFPVSAEHIDQKVEPDAIPIDSGDEFMLLNAGFLRLLNELSAQGPVTYTETDYFGGTGGQGSGGFSKGKVLMPPTWRAIGAALELIGVDRGESRDRFKCIGLDQVRDNDDLLDRILESDG